VPRSIEIAAVITSVTQRRVTGEPRFYAQTDAGRTKVLHHELLINLLVLRQQATMLSKQVPFQLGAHL
jgi:hypothetical protein